MTAKESKFLLTIARLICNSKRDGDFLYQWQIINSLGLICGGFYPTP